MSVINRAKPVTYSVTPHATYPSVDLAAMVDGDSDWVATASSTTTGLARGNATESFDVGFVGWSQSAGATVTVTCDLGSAIPADFLLLKGWQGSSGIYRPTAITVEHSDNGSSWTADQTLTGLTGDAQAGAGYWIYRVDVTSSHRYWRATLTHGGQWLHLAAFELHSGWVNHAWGRPYTVSPAASGSLPDDRLMALITPGMSDWLTGGGKATNAEHGVDGASSSVVGWARTNGQTGVLRVDMGSAVGGDHIAVFGIAPFGSTTMTPAAIALAYSDDDSAWTTFFNKTGLVNQVATKATWIARSDISALGDHRYWRVTVTQGASGNFLGIAQMELWQEISSFDPANLQASVVDDDVTLTWDV